MALETHKSLEETFCSAEVSEGKFFRVQRLGSQWCVCSIELAPPGVLFLTKHSKG